MVDWSPDDKRLLVGEYVSINESYIWLVDVASGKKTLVTPKGSDEKIAYEPVAFSQDGKGDLRAHRPRLASSCGWRYIDLASKKHTVLVDATFPGTSRGRGSVARRPAAWPSSPTRTASAGCTCSTPQTAASWTCRRRLPVGVIGGLEWHENNRDLGFVRGVGPLAGRRLFAGRRQRQGRSLDATAKPAGSNAETFAEPELVNWKTFDDREISGFLYSPPAKFTGKRPVIDQHSRRARGAIAPGLSGPATTTFSTSWAWRMHLSERARLEPAMANRSCKLDNGFLREGTYRTSRRCSIGSARSDDLDAERVMVTGGSYGGHMTLAVAVRYSDRIRCSLDVVGISNLVTFLERTESYRRDLRRVEYGDERDPKMRAFLEKIAPLNHADEIKKPLFVVQGKNDPRVPLSESVQIVETLRKNKHAGLVPDGRGRRARVCQEEERRLPVLRHDLVRGEVPARRRPVQARSIVRELPADPAAPPPNLPARSPAMSTADRREFLEATATRRPPSPATALAATAARGRRQRAADRGRDRSRRHGQQSCASCSAKNKHVDLA